MNADMFFYVMLGITRQAQQFQDVFAGRTGDPVMDKKLKAAEEANRRVFQQVSNDSRGKTREVDRIAIGIGQYASLIIKAENKEIAAALFQLPTLMADGDLTLEELQDLIVEISKRKSK